MHTSRHLTEWPKYRGSALRPAGKGRGVRPERRAQGDEHWDGSAGGVGLLGAVGRPSSGPGPSGHVASRARGHELGACCGGAHVQPWAGGEPPWEEPHVVGVLSWPCRGSPRERYVSVSGSDEKRVGDLGFSSATLPPCSPPGWARVRAAGRLLCGAPCVGTRPVTVPPRCCADRGQLSAGAFVFSNKALVVNSSSSVSGQVDV